MHICPAIALLNKQCQKCIATINSIENLDANLQYELTRLGICKGCPISLHHNTIFSDPIVFNINNTHIALRHKDAKKITIKLDPHPN